MATLTQKQWHTLRLWSCAAGQSAGEARWRAGTGAGPRAAPGRARLCTRPLLFPAGAAAAASEALPLALPRQSLHDSSISLLCCPEDPSLTCSLTGWGTILKWSSLQDTVSLLHMKSCSQLYNTILAPAVKGCPVLHSGQSVRLIIAVCNVACRDCCNGMWQGLPGGRDCPGLAGG